MLVRDLMTHDPVTARPQTPVEDIADLLLAHRINGVPVVDQNNRVLGVVTAADLVYRAADEPVEPRRSFWKENFWVSFLDREGNRPGKSEGHSAADVMTRAVHSVAPDDAPAVAARLMADFRLTSLPVIEAGVLVGVISRIDLVRRLPDIVNLSEQED